MSEPRLLDRVRAVAGPRHLNPEKNYPARIER